MILDRILHFKKFTELKVALKIINRRTAPKDFLEKFLPRELEIIQVLNHKNIVRAYEIITIGSKIYISLEWAGHGDLLQFVRLKGALKESDCRRLYSRDFQKVLEIFTLKLTSFFNFRYSELTYDLKKFGII